MAGIFGPTPQEIQQAQRAQQLNRASVLNQVPRNLIAGQMAGGALTSLLGGNRAQNEQIEKARKMQQVQQQIANEGLRPGTRAFTNRVTQLLRSTGDVDLAMQAFAQATKLEQARANVDVTQASLPQEADPNEVLDNMTALTAIGIPEAQARVLAKDSKQVANLLRQRHELTASQKDILDPDVTAHKLAMARASAARQTVTLPANATEFQKVMGRKAAEWFQGRSFQGAESIRELKNIIRELQGGGNLTGVWQALVQGLGTPGAALTERGTDVRNRVEKVLQDGARDILDHQYAATEMRELLARSFNPALSPEFNVRRLIAHVSMLENAWEQRQSMAEAAASGRGVGDVATLAEMEKRMADLRDQLRVQSGAVPSENGRLGKDLIDMTEGEVDSETVQLKRELGL